MSVSIGLTLSMPQTLSAVAGCSARGLQYAHYNLSRLHLQMACFVRQTQTYSYSNMSLLNKLKHIQFAMILNREKQQIITFEKLESGSLKE